MLALFKPSNFNDDLLFLIIMGLIFLGCFLSVAILGYKKAKKKNGNTWEKLNGFVLMIIFFSGAALITFTTYIDIWVIPVFLCICLCAFIIISPKFFPCLSSRYKYNNFG